MRYMIATSLLSINGGKLTHQPLDRMYRVSIYDKSELTFISQRVGESTNVHVKYLPKGKSQGKLSTMTKAKNFAEFNYDNVTEWLSRQVYEFDAEVLDIIESEFPECLI